MESLLPVVVGGIIGVAGGVLGPLLHEILRQNAERKNLTAALISEINSLLQIVERRKYFEELEKLISYARLDNSRDIKYIYRFSVRRNPFSVYDANLSKIGILKPPLPKKITQFYAQAASILEDIADMSEGKNIPIDPKSSIERLEALLQLGKDTIELGREIVSMQVR
jgi:hypothetical protein